MLATQVCMFFTEPSHRKTLTKLSLFQKDIKTAIETTPADYILSTTTRQPITSSLHPQVVQEINNDWMAESESSD